ncbi:MAG TPA: hypothetical protein VD997_06020 [Phycisphaerales bacterium]|nr:hypothetical protein [Phycisphaerales bacterium]
METLNSSQPGPIRVTQVMVAALMFGLLTASAVMFMLVHMGVQQPQHGLEILLYVLAALWPVCAIMSVVMNSVMVRQARAQWNNGSGQGDEDDLLPAYSSAVIVRGALLEGPGLFGAVAFMLTGNMLALIAPALSLAALGLIFPSQEKFRAFVRDVTDRS